MKIEIKKVVGLNGLISYHFDSGDYLARAIQLNNSVWLVCNGKVKVCRERSFLCAFEKCIEIINP